MTCTLTNALFNYLFIYWVCDLEKRIGYITVRSDAK